MVQSSFETRGDVADPIEDTRDRISVHEIHLIDMPDGDDTADFPPLSDLINLTHKKLDITWLPEGSEPLGGWFQYEGFEFIHKDSKDPHMVVEPLADGSSKYHIYFSRGVSHDILEDPVSHEPIMNPFSEEACLNDPIIHEIERWEVGHLTADSWKGPWTEVETAKMWDVHDKPQMCAPSMLHADNEIQMIIQAACFFPNFPIYQFTTTDGTIFRKKRELLLPIAGTTESGLYDVDCFTDNGKYFIVYSAMAPITGKRKAINEIHLAYIPSLAGEGEAERLVQLADGLWARVVKRGEGDYGYYSLDDTDNTSPIIRLNTGEYICLMKNSDGDEIPMSYSNDTWTVKTLDNENEWIETYQLSAPQPGTPIITDKDVPMHNPHPPLPRDDETEAERAYREKLEANCEWGLEAVQIIPLPNGTYLLIGVCFLEDMPRGNRQRVFMAASEKLTGPYVSMGILIDPHTDKDWGDGENGHPSAQIIGDKLHILYQARRPFHDDLSVVDRLAARWQFGEAVCDVDEICRLTEATLKAQYSNNDKLAA